MKNKSIFFIIFFAIVFPINLQAKNCISSITDNLYFIKNEGQIIDQYHNLRNDIQFSLHSKGTSIFVGSGSLHYQFSKSNFENQKITTSTQNKSIFKSGLEIKNIRPANIETYRIDVTLLGANKYADVITEDPQNYFENYYLPGCKKGIQAHSFKKITYENIYPDIDWVLCIKDNKLEEEFIIKPGGDASRIKFEYNGQTNITMHGDSVVTINTPMGIINEHTPICYWSDGSHANVSYALQKNVLTYQIADISKLLVIDPLLEWGTYYGPDTSGSPMYDIVCDSFANIYGCGFTYSATSGTIATSGSYQSVIGGGSDAYLVKFDSLGNRLWGTYFGGSKDELGSAVACDQSGNVYLGGTTNSLTNIATPGSQLTTYQGGLWGGYLAKFNPSGALQWATYVGGTNGSAFDLEINSINCDLFGHVYVCGSTDDTANVATPGSFKPYKHEGMDTAIDCFVIQYDTAGRRLWGTYYGGPGSAKAFSGVGCSDGLYEYLSGWTDDTTSSSIATPGAYQTRKAGITDAFLVKFDSSGNRIWGTYYGGRQQETTGGVTCDKRGNLYLLGATSSDDGIATPHSYHNIRIGLNDAFLVKFDSSGDRIWGTYYGGPDEESVLLSRIVSSDSSDETDIYITGNTASTSYIASTGAWQTTYGGGDEDAFLAKFTGEGELKWSTYYGGVNEDQGIACATDGVGVYVCGKTNSDNNIATPGSFLSSGGSGPANTQGFLARFSNNKSFLSASTQILPGNVHLYPTVSSGLFTISGTISGGNNIVQITVTDVTGNTIVKDEAVTSNGALNKQIDLNNGAPAGEYFVNVVSAEAIFHLRFVKE